MSKSRDVVKQIMIAVLELNQDDQLEDITMDSNADWDSMRHVSIITGLENEFGIFVEADQAENLTSYDKLVTFINEHPEID